MLNLVKKMMYLGVGLAVITKDKAEELTKELIKKGELPENEGKTFVKELMKKSEESKKEIEKQIKGLVTETINKMKFPKNTEVEKLREEVAKLSERIQKLDN